MQPVPGKRSMQALALLTRSAMAERARSMPSRTWISGSDQRLQYRPTDPLDV